MKTAPGQQPNQRAAERRRITYQPTTAQLQVRAAGTAEGEALPKGVCGRMSGIALVYGVVDTWGTKWQKGCLDRTRAEKVAAGKVKLFVAVDGGHHQYGTKSHVGTVRSLKTVGDAEVMEADIFDTADGRAFKEYLEAVLATESETGLSVGVYERDGFGERASENGKDRWIYTFTEAELVEITVTTMNAVPGTQATTVRADAAAGDVDGAQLQRVALDALLRTLPEPEVRAALHARFGDDFAGTPPAAAPTGRSDSDAAPGRTPGADSDAAPVSMEARIAAFRASYAPATAA